MTDTASTYGSFLSLDKIRVDRFIHNKEEEHVILYNQMIELSKDMTSY